MSVIGLALAAGSQQPSYFPRPAPLGFVSPIEYGAKFDGVTDDTAAMNAALAAAYARGVEVRCPAGTSVLQPFTIPQGVRLSGVRGATTLYCKRLTYTLYSSFITGSQDSTLANVVVDTNDALFGYLITGGSSETGQGLRPYAASSVARPRLENVEFYGQSDLTVLFIGCTDIQMIDCTITATSNSVFRAVQTIGCTGGVISNLRCAGASGATIQSHVVSIDTSSNILVLGMRSDLITSGGFSISFTSSVNCHALSCNVQNSQLEGLQMTLCTGCTMSYCTVSWTISSGIGAGQDFGSSMDACVRCEFVHSSFENSFKGACALATDSGPSQGNIVAFNRTHNCAVRGTAATSPGPVDSAVFPCYAGNSNAQSGNTFTGNVINLDTGKTVLYGYQEYGASTVSNAVTGMKINGPGTVTNPYAPLSNTTSIHSDILESFTPTVTASSGAFSTGTPPVATGVFRRDGLFLDVQMSVSFPSGSIGTASGTLILSQPLLTNSARPYYGIGREDLATGAELSITAQYTTAQVRTYNNAFPVPSSGASNIDLSYRTSIQ